MINIDLAAIPEFFAKSAYDKLGKNYYFGVHPTSRIFDEIINQYIKKNPISLKPKNTYLEVGCGRSRIVKMRKHKSTKVIILDISQEMLINSYRYFTNYNVQAINASALWMSLSTSSITGQFSFLGDPFNNSSYFQESYRVLKNKGEFLHIIPNYVWATTLRKIIKIPIDTTEFLNNDNRIRAPSFVIPNSDVKGELEKLGFLKLTIQDLFVPNSFPKGKIPEHILIPAKKLDIEPNKLPILTVIHAIK